MEEVWRDIPGYEGRYQASTLGRIRSVDRVITAKSSRRSKSHARHYKGMILSPGRVRTGHMYVVLGNKSNGTPVHQLVAKTFLGNPPDGMEVLHANGDPADNRLENLRYGTRTENILDVYKVGKAWRKLTMSDALAIKHELELGDLTGRQIAEKFGVSEHAVSNIKTGKTYWWLT